MVKTIWQEIAEQQSHGQFLCMSNRKIRMSRASTGLTTLETEVKRVRACCAWNAVGELNRSRYLISTHNSKANIRRLLRGNVKFCHLSPAGVQKLRQFCARACFWTCDTVFLSLQLIDQCLFMPPLHPFMRTNDRLRPLQLLKQDFLESMFARCN